MKIERYIPVPSQLAEELHQHLVETDQTLSNDELITFLLSVTDDHGNLCAGCKGEIAFKSARVSELWVSEGNRGNGFGTKLLAEAEAIAVERDCERIHLETRNPKAKLLYERLGYSVFGELPNYEGTLSFYYLEKRLR
ncbi:GNAT family N-acetyltransferase [Parasulfitobacter algicola]|uniref:GNAT family N-acetyltransferase n=1 Tax=Parasulfitobacter algicola TaxID=2614809 RepID=A0ABX2IVN9_9RHOB|nr:GNAT family N-acetyltransferase [Sulfitobacter algicola]NSX56973.1 GNAT family N-acetyltransferase [Sulfitobacter algicola]